MMSCEEWSDSHSFRKVAIGSAFLVVGFLFVYLIPFIFYDEITALASSDDTITLTASDFVVFLTAVIGVGGSYSIYRRRRRDLEHHLRQSLFAETALVGDQLYEEIQDMTVNQLGSELYVPDESPIVLTAYQNNAGEIGRLSGNEVEKLNSFYTLASIIRPRVERVIEQDDVDEMEVGRLRGRLVELFNRRNKALEAMKQELSQPPVEVKYEDDIEEGDDLEELAESLGIR